jgi:hypothetical protein
LACRMTGWKGVALLAGALALQACAAKTPPAKSAPAVALSPYSVPGKVGKLVVLPAEGLLFPETANILNTTMAGVRFSNVGESSLAKVSMEVAQLSLECVDTSEACYQSVGRFLEADHILWSEVASDDGADGKTCPTVSIRLFDVEAGRLLGNAQQSYAKAPTAQDMDVLLRKALAGSRGSTGRQ